MESAIRNRHGNQHALWAPPRRARVLMTLALTLGVVACSITDHRTEQERVADRSLADHVHDALRADENLYAAHINVDAKGGVVWLTGFVNSADEAQLASQDSKTVPGVQRVVNQIEVVDWMPHM